MIRIVSNNLNRAMNRGTDFTDVSVRRFHGAISESLDLLGNLQERLSNLLRVNNNIRYSELVSDPEIDAALRQIDFELSGFIRTNK